MTYWISRDSGTPVLETIDIWDEKPTLNGYHYALDNYRCRRGYILLETFEKITGVKLKPGERRRVKSMEIVLEDT